MRTEVFEKKDILLYDAALIVAPEGYRPAGADAELEEIFASGAFTGKNESLYRYTRFEKGKLTHIFLLGAGAAPTRESLLYACSKAYREIKELRPASVITDLSFLGRVQNAEELFEIVCESAYISAYRFDKYKPEEDFAGFERADFICGEKFPDALMDAAACAKATMTARDLINEPPTVMIPERLAASIAALFEHTGVRVSIYDKKQIEELGLTAFLEVGKGSIYEPRLIVMEYDGAPETDKRLGLIGKGLTYDSGGYSLQSSGFMETMQHDMSGAAAVAAAIFAAQERKLRINVTGVVAACENKLSATAYVPGDVIRSMSGRYIEVNNTDAEGRITLADAVTYIKTHHRVNGIVDIATLTDGIQTALGDRRAGLFSNDRALAGRVFEAGEYAVEKVWELPLDENIRRVLDSRVACLKNSAMGSSVGAYATVGAMFIREFVGDTPWAHLDIGGVAWTREEGYFYTKGGIGFGARLLYRLMKAGM